MRYYLGHTESQMAAQLELRWWLHAARTRLRQLLAGMGLSSDPVEVNNHE
jgi:hypothetical protein